MSNNLFSSPLFPPALRARIADRYATFGGWQMEAGEGSGGGEVGDGDAGSGEGGQTFTQADVDKIIGKTRSEERRKVSERFADYDDLKKRAEGAKTLEDRVAEIEKAASDAARRAEVAEVANEKGLTPAQAKRLVGSTREELLADADELLKDIGAQQKQGNRVPREGNTSTAKAGDERATVRSLFGSGG